MHVEVFFIPKHLLPCEWDNTYGRCNKPLNRYPYAFFLVISWWDLMRGRNFFSSSFSILIVIFISAPPSPLITLVFHDTWMMHEVTIHRNRSTMKVILCTSCLVERALLLNILQEADTVSRTTSVHWVYWRQRKTTETNTTRWTGLTFYSPLFSSFSFFLFFSSAQESHSLTRCNSQAAESTFSLFFLSPRLIKVPTQRETWLKCPSQLLV